MRFFIDTYSESNSMVMPTYKQIQNKVKRKYNFSPNTCWIADVKEKELKLKVRHAPNRKDPNKRQIQCPEKYKQQIKMAIQQLIKHERQKVEDK